MNRAIITGRTTKDFKTYTSKSGTLIAKTSVAADSGFGDNKKTDFLPITVFGKTAEFCANYVKKGDLVEVIGRIATGSYTKSDGVVEYTTDINVDDIKKLSSAQAKAKETAEAEPYTPSNFEALQEDIPF